MRGHHIYKPIWTPVLGEKLQIKIEEEKHHDSRAVAVIKDGVAKDDNNCVIYSLRSFDCEFQKNSQFAIKGTSQSKPVLQYINLVYSLHYVLLHNYSNDYLIMI